ncbi:MAG: hypothetical protein ACYTXA_20160 [Nostoc sp.]
MPNKCATITLAFSCCYVRSRLLASLITGVLVIANNRHLSYPVYSRSLLLFYIAVSIQMRYNITSRGVGARQCRAPTGVPDVNENRYRTSI